MKELKDRAREARELANEPTVPPWAKKLKVSTTAIYLIEGGKTLDLKAATADGMARLSGLSAEWIRTGKLPKFSSEAVGSQSARLPLATVRDAVQLLQYTLENLGEPPAMVHDMDLLETAYSIVDADGRNFDASVMLDLNQKLSAQIREKEAKYVVGRGSTEGASEQAGKPHSRVKGRGKA